jgi:hypothetical protein
MYTHFLASPGPDHGDCMTRHHVECPGGCTVQHHRHDCSLTWDPSTASELHYQCAMQDVGDKAKDAANQTEGAIKDAAGAVKDKVSQPSPCSSAACVGRRTSCCPRFPVQGEAVCRTAVARRLHTSSLCTSSQL